MNTNNRHSKIFSITILLLLLILSLGTIAFAGTNNTSYSLTIIKRLNLKGIPEGTDIDYAELSYAFNVTGAGKDGEAINTRGTINNFQGNGEGVIEGSTTIPLEASSVVSVIELSNTLDENLQGYGVSGTSYQSHMHVNNNYAEVTLSKESNSITVTTPAASDGLEPISRVYQVIGPTGDGCATREISILDGGSHTLEDLPAGNYQIRQKKAPDGFEIEITNPKIEVKPGESKTIHLDDTSGRLTITAGGTDDDGATHHFIITRKNGGSDPEFPKEFSLLSGEKYVLEHLVSDDYNISAKTFTGTETFTVETSDKSQEICTGSISVNTPKRGSLYINTNPISQADPTQGDFAYVGIEFTSSQANTKYTARFATGKNSIAILKNNENTGEYEALSLSDGSPQYYINFTNCNSGKKLNLNRKYRFPFDQDKKLRFGFPSVAANPNPLNISPAKLHYTVCRPQITTYTTANGYKVVNVRSDATGINGWLKITKPKDSNQAVNEHVTYNYTITNSTTDETYTITLGGPVNKWSEQISVPAGRYKITQTTESKSDGFTISEEDKQYTTSPKESITTTIMGEGSTIKLRKEKPEGDSSQTRPYRFKVTGPQFPAEGVIVSLKGGQEEKLRNLLKGTSVTAPPEGGGYTNGSYTITPLDDTYSGFDLDCSDSCTVVIVGQSATVTVTNSYAEVKGSYRVVHEYYSDDDMTQLDGISEISQFYGPVFSEHTEKEVTRRPNFTTEDGTPYIYEYRQACYGDYGKHEDNDSAIGNSLNTVKTISENSLDQEGKEQDTVSGNTLDEEEDDPHPDEENPDSEDSGDDNPDLENPDENNSGNDKPEPDNLDGNAPGINDADQKKPDSDNSDGENADDRTEIHSSPENPDSNMPGTMILYVETNAPHDANPVEEEPADTFTGNDIPDFQAPADETPARNPEDTGTAVPQSPDPNPQITTETTNQDTDPAADESLMQNKAPFTATINESGKESSDPAENTYESIQENDPLKASGFIDDGTYHENKDYESAQATLDGDQIIILRYVRREINTTGSYNVVHRYYLRDANGDTLEGSVTEDPPVSGLSLLDRKAYTADTVTQKPDYTPSGGIPHNYTYVGAIYGPMTDAFGKKATDQGYAPAFGKDCVYATQDGSEVIVLRYVRTISYNVVHEYYVRNPDGTISPDPGSDSSQEDPIGSPDNSDSGVGSEDSDNIGTTAGNFTYELEGNGYFSTVTGNKDEIYTEARVDRIPLFRPSSNKLYRYTPYEYAYGRLDSNDEKGYSETKGKDGATASENGDEVIIIRYYREYNAQPEPEPDAPGKPTPPPDQPGTNPDPQPPIEEVPELPGVPEFPEIPETPDASNETGTPGQPEEKQPETPGKPEQPEEPRRTELPDPNSPDSPDTVTVWENGKTVVYTKVWNPADNTWIYLPEGSAEEERLDAGPKTGDESNPGLWLTLALGSLAALYALHRLKKYKSRTSAELSAEESPSAQTTDSTDHKNEP